MTEVGQYLKLKAQLEDQTTIEDVLSKQAAVLDKLGEARASVERVGV